MDSKEATKKFQLSQKLFAEKRYEDALAIMDNLESSFPHTKNIMYPRALCLAKLGRYDEAMHVCEQLISVFDDPRAQKLLAHVKAKGAGYSPAFDVKDLQAVPDMTGPVGFEGVGQAGDPLGLDEGTFQVHAKAAAAAQAAKPSSSKKFYIVLGVIVVVVVGGLLALGLMRGGGSDQPTQTASTPGEPTPAQPASTTGSISWYTSYNQGMMAQDNNMAPVLLYFHSPASEDCQRMDEEVFKQPSIVQLLDGWVCIKADIERESDAAADHGVQSAPELIILDGLGMQRHTRSGYASANDLYNTLTELNLRPIGDLKMPAYALAVMILGGVLITPWPLYLTLMMFGKLPNNEFLKDIVSVGLVAIGISALSNILPCIGFIISIFLLIKLYDMGFLDIIVWLGLSIVFGAIFAAAMVAIVGMSFLEQLPMGTF